MGSIDEAPKQRSRRWLRIIVGTLGLAVVAFDLLGGSAAAKPETRAAPVDQPAKQPAPKAEKGGIRSAFDRCGRRRKDIVLSGRLNLNTATEKQLTLLPGVGMAKARRVIRWRARKRRFRRVRDLRRVRGFGYRTVKRLARYLSVRGPSSLAWRTLDEAQAAKRAALAGQKRPTSPTR